MYFLIILLLITVQTSLQNNTTNAKLKMFKDDEKSSLVFVFDTTGSMFNDLKQLREGAEMILNTALEESNVIADFVFVPFHDPAVGPATVTRNKAVFKAALNIVRVYGGGDCPEKSLTGIQLALNVSRPRSYIYVFTDATANDHRLVGRVLDLVQRKQSQVVFVLTGHCNDLKRPSYLVYQQIAAASSGQVFNLNKTNVHKVLDFVRSSIKARTVNLGSVRNPAGYNYTQGIPVDSTLGEVTVSVSGSKPQIKVFSPTGEQVTGPPKLVTTLDLAEIMVVKVLQPEPGNWSITVGSEAEHSVKVVGLSNLTFNHGFSVQRPASPAETSYRPLQGTYNYMMLSLTETDKPVHISHAEILTLDGKTLFELPLTEVDPVNKIYLAEAFMPPDEFFYIAINGLGDNNQELRRVGATAIQAKSPEVPYLTVPKKVEAYSHQAVALRCDVESLVPVNAMWTKDGTRMRQQISSLQSTSLTFAITDMNEEHAGTYRCFARNVAGVSEATTVLEMLVEPPVVTISANATSLTAGEPLTITCTVLTETLLTKYRLIFNGKNYVNETEISIEPNYEGVYKFEKTIEHVSERDGGMYSCVAAHRGGIASKSLNISVSSLPSAQILGPHTLPKTLNSLIQLVCHVENSNKVQWLYNGVRVESYTVNGSYNAILEKKVIGDGVWSCVASQGDYNVSDSVEIIVLIKPEVSIEGMKNITILNGTEYNMTCLIRAKPEPRILWHKETETFLNNSITKISPELYRSELTLNSAKGEVNGTYFCFGENSEGIHQDSVTVNVRRAMKVIRGLSDISVQLYSNVTMECAMDSYPKPHIRWYHNTTELLNTRNVYNSEEKSTIIIEKVNFNDLGTYVCEADNGYEKLSVNGTLSVYGLEIPSVSKEPRRKLARKANSTILTCSILKGNPEPVLTWQYKGSTDNFTQLPNDIIVSENCSEIMISTVRVEHTGLYRCVAENLLGRDMYEVELLVQYLPQIELNKVSNPRPLEIEAGQSTTLPCQVIGVPKPMVVWTKDNRPLSFTKNIYLSNTSDLTIKNVTEYDSGVFSCNASNILGSSVKNFTVNIYVTPKITSPVIEPELEFLEGQLVELPCAAQGWPRPEVQWLQNGQEVKEDRKYVDEFGLRFVANLTDFGEYTCIVNNKYGKTNLTYIVYIWVLPVIEPPLEIEVNVLAGENVNLNCDAVGFPIPVILWEFKGEIMKENSTELSFNDSGNMNITNASSKHEGLYACLAENMVGFARKNIYLHVNEPPTILEDKYNGSYIATDKDELLLLACKAAGKPEPYVYWTKDNLYLDKDSRYEVEMDGTLKIKSPSEELSGEYVCLAKNTVGEANKTVTVEIYSLPARIQADESESMTTLLEGTEATLDCPVKTSRSDVVAWYKDAKLISNGRLTFKNVSRKDSAIFACVVTNAVGSAYTKLRVNVEWPPCFSKEEAKEVEVVERGDHWFGCEVDANPKAKIKWLFNSKVLVGEEKDRLRLINAQLHHTGVYKCLVSNIHGTVVRTFSLDVLVPPFITEFDLLDVQLKEGMNASLECNAKGSPKPEIKWTYNNTNWHTVNSTLLAINTSTNSEGLFRCDARNKAGSTHLVYRVGIVATPAVREVVLFSEEQGETVEEIAEVVLGTNVRISCKVSGHPIPTIQWIKNGLVLSENLKGISYADLSMRVNSSHGGVYTCAASNEGGIDSKRIKVDVLEPPQIFQTLFQNANSTEKEMQLEVMSGQAFYLHCHPYGNPVPEVYWFKDGLPLRFFDDTMFSSEFGEIIQTNKARFEQSGNYTCVARNKVGNTSVVYLVDVLVPPPTLKDASRSTSIRVGKPLTLTCPVEGSPVPTVMWIKHPYTDVVNTSRVTLSEDNVTLIIHDTETPDSGLYSCIMTNKVGTTEVMFDVTVEKPPSIAGNVGANVTETRVVPLRRSVVLKCEVDGHPMPKISWLKDTQQLSNNTSNIQLVLSNSLLAIWALSVRDAGQYICVASNSAGAALRRHNVVPQVPGKWSDWSQWSYCNVTCGLGYQNRSRTCQYVDDFITIDDKSKSEKYVLDQSACKGLGIERRRCHMPPCEDEAAALWSGWSKWSPCSSSCGTGSQARSRRCRTNHCAGDNVQIRKCPDLPQCDSKQDPSENEVYSENDLENETGENDTYMPEAAFEFQSEVVEAEEFYISPVSTPNKVFDVKISGNPEQGPCGPGYIHNPTTQNCDDIDECQIENNQCHSTQTCLNTLGGYRCGCPRGYASLGAGQRCLDINECTLDIDGCEYACVNVAGGHVCACPRQLRLHTDKRHCVAASSYRKPYHEPDAEYLSALIEAPAKYKNTRN